MKLRVKKTELRASLLFVSQDLGRPQLQCVHIETRYNKNPVIVSVDGRQLSVIESYSHQDNSSRETFTVTIYADAVRQIVDMAGGDDVEIAACDDGSVIAKTEKADLRVLRAIREQRDYPNWRSTIPQKHDTIADMVPLRADFLAKYQKAANLLCDKDDCCVLIRGHSPTEPFEITLSGILNFFSVLMPMRVDSRERPDFIQKQYIVT